MKTDTIDETRTVDLTLWEGLLIMTLVGEHTKMVEEQGKPVSDSLKRLNEKINRLMFPMFTESSQP